MARPRSPAIISAMALVGERKACGAAVLAFFTSLFTLNALLGPPELGLLFGGLAAIYGMAFFGLVAGWFWARWYTTGVAFSGLAMAVMLAWQIGLDPIVWIWGGSHAVVLACLLGAGPASAFDARLDWRQRWRLDENAVNRLGKAVQRAGASLPYLVMAGLAPKQSMGMSAFAAVAALALGVVGLRALVRMRSWGLLAMAGAAALSVGATFDLGTAVMVQAPSVSFTYQTAGLGVVAAMLLAAACAPFVRPLARFLRS